MLSLVSISSNKISDHIINNVLSTKEFLFDQHLIEKVEKDIMSLNLPHTLEDNIKQVASSLILGIEIYNDYMLMCGVKVYPNFVSIYFFAMDGTVDYKLTTRELVLNKKLNIKVRVILACMFCFEEEVLAFWKSQPDILRNLTKQNETTTLTKWLKYLEETEEPLEQFLWKDYVLLEAAFLAAVDEINLVAAEYFLTKMVSMPNDKKISILRTARVSFYPNDEPISAKSIFIRRMKFFLASSQLKECNISLKNELLKKDVLNDKYNILNDKYGSLNDKYRMLINKFKNENEMLKNKHDSLNDEYKMSTNKLKNENEMLYKKFMEYYEMLSNETTCNNVYDENRENMLKNETELLNNEDMLETSDEMLQNEDALLENERELLNNEQKTLEEEWKRSNNDCQIIQNESDMLINEMRMLIN